MECNTLGFVCKSLSSTSPGRVCAPHEQKDQNERNKLLGGTGRGATEAPTGDSRERHRQRRSSLGAMLGLASHDRADGLGQCIARTRDEIRLRRTSGALD